MQITSNPASQSSLLQISGIGNFQYFSEVDPNDICSLRSKYHRNWRSNTSLTYYHKTETSHNSGHGAVKHSTQSDCSYMEDRSLVTTFLMPALDAEPILLAGVFDGHGGEKCSEHIEANLSSVLQKYLLAFSDAKNYPNFTLDAIVCNALKQTLVELDYTFNENKGGSTATVSVKIGNVLYTANVGDSRTILVAPTQWKQLSLDAEANQDPHSTIIQKLGGTFTKNRDEDSYRISHDIAMGSSIGDHSTIGTNPTVTFSKTDLTQYPDAVLVAVSDGATDVATSHEIAQAIQGTYFPENGLSLPDTAVALGYSFYKNESQDNITVVMVDLSRLTGF
jgi:protein phosphatase 1L